MLKNLAVFIFFTFVGFGAIAAYIKALPQTQLKEPIKLPFINQNQFSLENAPTDSLKGKVSTLSGDVKWQDRVATQPASITNPVNIQQGEELTTGDNGIVNVEIPTAALVSISPKSHIGFVQTLPQNIVFAQDKGTIQYQKIGSFPVSIRSLRLLVQLESGNLTISVSETKPTIIVEVKDGLGTAAFNDSQNVSNVLTIHKGEKLIFQNDTKQGVIK